MSHTPTVTPGPQQNQLKHRPGIELRNLTFSYPNSPTVLQGINLQLEPGQFILVAGPSGAGKSTLLRTLDGLVPHFTGGHISGEVSVLGHDPIAEGPHSMSRVVGLVPQDPEVQFVVDTVEDELAFAMENQGMGQDLMQRRVEEVLQQLGLSALRQRRIHTLSAGQKQRVAIGSVLTLLPQVLVLDEPTSQLDPEAAEDVLGILQQLNREQGMTIILSEHRLERVVEYVDRIVYVAAPGQPLLTGPPREILPEMPFAPAAVQLGRTFGWKPVPLSVSEARVWARSLALDPPSRTPQREITPVLIQVQDLWFDYGTTSALRGVSLAVHQGELLAVMGRNGVGKTTLLRHLLGLLSPKQGRVTVQGLDTAQTPLEELTRYVGYVPQDPNALLFSDTVRQELAFTRHAHGLPPADEQPWLDLLGLSSHGDRYPRSLSVGERQRVALAAILVAEPPILLLDEPTRGLDPVEKHALAQFLRAQAAGGRTIVMATHDVELVAECAQRVVVLEEGRVALDGPAGEVMSQAKALATQVLKLFRDPRLLTVQDVLEARSHAN